MTGLAPRAPVAEQAPLYHPARGPARPWPEDEAFRQGLSRGRVSSGHRNASAFLFPPEPHEDPGPSTQKSGTYFVSVPRALLLAVTLGLLAWVIGANRGQIREVFARSPDGLLLVLGFGASLAAVLLTF